MATLLITTIFSFTSIFYGLFMPPLNLQKNIQKKLIPIDEKVQLTLGKTSQTIWVRSEHKENPILLFLHGGPGFPAMPYSRVMEKKLVKHFTLVHWDQRGAGQSFHCDLNPETMTIEQLSSDLFELIQWLKTTFKRQKLYLVGQSWGTILGLRHAFKYPQDLHAYVALSQVVDGQKGPLLSYDFTLKTAQDRKHKQALKELVAIGHPPHHTEAKKIQQKWTLEFGGMLHQPIRYNVLQILLSSVDYNLFQIYNLYQGFNFSNRYLSPQIQSINFFSTIKKLAIPVYFLHGRYDHAVPSQLSFQFFQQIAAPYKEFIWFENSAHSLNKEEPIKFQQTLINLKSKHGLH